MGSQDNDLYEFGDFTIDAEEAFLRRGEELISLAPKVFETLFFLVKRQGAIVSKTEMLNTIWADAFVEESNLTQNIYTLRKILGTDANGKQIIETIARRGYRIAVPVRVLRANEKVAANGLPADDFFARETQINLEPAYFTNDANNADTGKNATISAFVETQKPLVENSLKKKRARIAWRKTILAVLGVLVFAAVGFAVYQIFSQRAATNETKTAPIAQARFQRLTDSGDLIHPTISPSGETLAFVRLGEREQSVWLKQLATGSEMQTLPPSAKGYGSLAFSPDGNYLYFREMSGAVYQSPVFGGTPKKVAEKVGGDFSVSPDGKQLAFLRREPQNDSIALIIANIDGSGERELGRRKITEGGYRATPAWSPDGAKIVVGTSSMREARPLLMQVETGNGRETELKTPNWWDFSRALWMPDGKRLLIVARAADEPSSQIWIYDLAAGAAERLTNDLENYFWLSISADGQKIVARQQQLIAHLWQLPDADLTKAAQITSGVRARDGIRGLLWTPDGKIVFTAIDGSVARLYSIEANGGSRVSLTPDVKADNTFPSASADGRYIVFTSNRTGARQIWRMDADGRNQKQLTSGEEAKESAIAPVVSPDGAEVYFIKGSPQPSAIWKTSIEGGAMQPVSNFNGATAQDFLSISPDGKLLAYRHAAGGDENRSEDVAQKIGVLAIGGGEPKLFDLAQRPAAIRWAKDSSAFYFISGAGNNTTLWRQPLAGGEPQKVIDFPDRVFNFAWSPDGKNLVVARGRQIGDAVLISNLP